MQLLEPLQTEVLSPGGVREPFPARQVPMAEMLQPCRVGEQRGDVSAKGTEE